MKRPDFADCFGEAFEELYTSMKRKEEQEKQ